MKTSYTTDILNRWMRFLGVILMLALIMPAVAFSQTVNLGTASSFAVLAAAGIGSTGNTALTGDIGSYPTATISGFGPGTFSGTNHGGDATTQQAMKDLNAAYLIAVGRSVTSTVGSALSGTMTAGVYNSADGTFGITGNLILSGTASDVFIFQTTTTLITGANCNVTLTGGAVWNNVFWQVGSSATLGASPSVLEGTILAYTSISASDGATVHGRLLAGAGAWNAGASLWNGDLTGAVTLINNTALPVELVAFTATANHMNADLHWSTATEVNNYGFDVERRLINSQSSTVSNWEKIGFVEGNGTSNSAHSYSYTDASVSSGTSAYRLKQIDNDGTYKYSSEAEITIAVPKVIALNQNYPNPFNPTTTITFTLAQDGFTTLKIYDVLGREVTTLVNGEMKSGVVNTVNFNASKLSSGIYFSRLENSGNVQMKKLMLLK